MSIGGLTMLMPVASLVIKDLIKKSTNYLGSNIPKGLEDLETTLLPQFQITIQAAENSPHTDELKKWLARLKNAYYEAEGILHELEYARLQQTVKTAEKKISVRISSNPIIKPLVKLISKVNKKASPVKKPLSKFTSKVSEKISLLSPKKRKLWHRLNKLMEVAAQATTFRDLLRMQTGDKNDTPVVDSCQATTEHLAHEVFGRDEVCDEIIKFLLEDQEASGSRSRHSVVAITGVGGAGKTTLAQYVYNNDKVRKYFGDMRIWICLSHQNNMDIMQRTKEMMEFISRKKCPSVVSLSVLRNNLIEILSDPKAVLIVLDDVWYDDKSKAVLPQGSEDQWDNLLAPFYSLGERCKIVITSRSESFPVALLPRKHIQLRDLAHNDFLALFRYYAFYGLEYINIQLKNHLSDIGNKIAQKISKSPLAAKVAGNQLCKQPNIKFWQATLENVNLSNTMDVLLWSYECLDAQLQRCFLLCSVFPKGTLYSNPFDLVQLWVALDFVESEDVGLEYFNRMIATSIFQELENERYRYAMHDLFHDLAQKLSAGECFRLTDSEKNIPETTVLHVSIAVKYENLKEKLSSISKLPNLRTLILGNPIIEDEDMSEIFSMISTMFKNLRVLQIWSRGYRTLPRAVGDLRNLRYLLIRGSAMEELPDSVLQLYHLQFLSIPDTVKNLPTKLCNLIKLRDIWIFGSDGATARGPLSISNIGKLTSLQHLEEFHVRKTEGYELGQLGSLGEIGGSLTIANLENVKDKDDAVKAKLKDKTKIDTLQLVWGELAESSTESADVIEALRPPENLLFLTIVGYRGSRYPTWLQEGYFLDNIKHMGFHNCNALPRLPPNFHKFRHCSQLILQNLGSLRELSTFPENLTMLKIIKSPCLFFVRKNELQLNENQCRILKRVQLLRLGDEACNGLLDYEAKCFQQFGEYCQEQLQILESTAQYSVEELQKIVMIFKILAFLNLRAQLENVISTLLEDTIGGMQVIWNIGWPAPWDNLIIYRVRQLLLTLMAIKVRGWTVIQVLLDQMGNHVRRALSKMIIRAWWRCHQQRMNFIFSDSSQGNKLKLPHRIRVLELGYCNLSDGALSECLRGMAALEELYIDGIMTITTLPPAKILKSLESLRVLKIKDCWSLRSLGGMHALPSLLEFDVNSCLCLETISARDVLRGSVAGQPRLPRSLQTIRIIDCILHEDILNNDLPCLENVVVLNCTVYRSLSFGQLTSLKSLLLLNCPNLFFVQGLRPFMDSISLVLLPNLSVESILQCCRGCRDLYISSSMRLNRILSTQNFSPPQRLVILQCQEEEIMFEISDHLQSINILSFLQCKTKNLPTSLREFSTLKEIYFKDCPEISRLPELPYSVLYIEISGCPLLKERCQPSGPDWDKIQHINYSLIE